MKYKLDKGSHSVYSLNYHFVQCTKYRKKVLIKPEIINLLKEQAHKISQKKEVEILNIETDKDHLHILFKAKPTTDLARYINTLKTITSREIQRTFPEVKKELRKNHFWSPSYFLATTGQTTLEQLKKYVDQQGTK